MYSSPIDANASMKATFAEPQIVTQNGKPVSVILPMAAYQELLEKSEDAADVAYLRKMRQKPMRYRSLEEYLNQRTTKPHV